MTEEELEAYSDAASDSALASLQTTVVENKTEALVCRRGSLQIQNQPKFVKANSGFLKLLILLHTYIEIICHRSHAKNKWEHENDENKQQLHSGE